MLLEHVESVGAGIGRSSRRRSRARCGDRAAFVGDDEKGERRETWKRPADAWPDGTVREQVARLPEQSLEGVMKAIPAKPPQHLFLGVPSLRQELALLPRGQVQLFQDSLRSSGPDADRRPWSWPELVYEIRGESSPAPEGGKPEVHRELGRGQPAPRR